MLPIVHVAWVVSFTIVIVGGQGRLGRELVTQSLERGWLVHTVVRRPCEAIYEPTRTGWLVPDDATSLVPIESDRLFRTNVTRCPPTADAIVFAMSGSPFATAAELTIQTEVVRRMCGTASSDRCRRMCLVSAHGVGDSLQGSNLGIRIMHDWYLRETYKAKLDQERIVKKNRIASLVVRPKVLSFSDIPLNTIHTTRYDLSKQILDWVDS